MNTNAQPGIVIPVHTRERRRAHEQEVLRIVADLGDSGSGQPVDAARTEVLKWAQNKTLGTLPQEAWKFESFELPAGGRNCFAVRIETEDQDIWSLRVEDPDKTVAERIWTTEITVWADRKGAFPKFSLRLSASTPEDSLEIEPHVPGVIRQVIDRPGLWSGNYKVLNRPIPITDNPGSEKLIHALLDPTRKVPIIALSIPEGSSDDVGQPQLDAKVLAQACAGLAIVVVLSTKASWSLTERFGKQLSVFNGAARVYLPGFTEDANPFGGHELLLPHRFENAEAAKRALTRLRWIAANGSIRRLQLGTDLLAFSSLKAQELQRHQAVLQDAGATASEQLHAANARIGLLENRLRESERYQKEFSDLHQEAEERAENAETQVRTYAFRIQQLLGQLKSSGVEPDAKIVLPENWESFAEWCDDLAGRVALSPQARRSLKGAQFEDVALAARCLLWLANSYRNARTNAEGPLRDPIVENGVINAHCGNDAYGIDWQGRQHEVNWHIKSTGNTRAPARCLRIYYFWDESSQQVVVASMPAHRRTDAT